jgi:hypothetical protein
MSGNRMTERLGETYGELLMQAGSVRGIVNTHCHHLPSTRYEGATLHQLMQMTYISWSNAPYPDEPAARAAFIDHVASNSYYQWMARGVGTLYGDGTPLDASNWDALDARLREAYRKPGHDLSILREACGYGSIVLDKYDRPGWDLGSPDLFRPTFRCDMFLHGYHADREDQNHNRPYDALDVGPSATLAEYIASIDRAVAAKKAAGCVALKLAIAYERDIAFENDDAGKAEAAMRSDSPDAQAVRDYQDYVVHRLADIAAKYGMPLQIHTGLGLLIRSNAMGLRTLIGRKPDTHFVLFHCGYPWMDDILGLLHNFRNVHPDLCWLPLISTSAAIRFIREALEVGDADRLTWGCDTWTSEESLGALLAVRHCLAAAIAPMCDEGLVDREYAGRLIRGILKDNAVALYPLGNTMQPAERRTAR